MREIRLYGSEGGGAAALPTPIIPLKRGIERPQGRLLLELELTSFVTQIHSCMEVRSP